MWRAGYVRRRPDPADRRRQVVEITDATAARDQEVFGDLIRATNDLLATYTDDQLKVMYEFLNRTRQLTATHAAAISGHDRPATASAWPARVPPRGSERAAHL